MGSNGDSAIEAEKVLKESVVDYTCSMHPEVSLDNAGLCPYCGMELVAATQEYSLGMGQFEMKEDALMLADVKTVRLSTMSEKEGSLKLSGLIRTNDKTNTIQTTLFGGRIDRLDITYTGQKIKKGQEIGLIYSPELYLAQDKLLTSASYKDTHVKLFKASRYGLGLWKLTDEQIDEIIRTGEPMLHFPMVADVSGTVTEIKARVGNFYKEGDPLFVLSDLRTVWAVFDAYENQIEHLSVGQEVVVHTEAYQGRSLKARIDFIEPVFNGATRTVAVRVDLDNKEGLLKPGMFVEAEVSINVNQEGLWIPRSSVLWTGKRSLVYIRSNPEQPVFEAREVTLGTSVNDYYQVLEGLEFGDEIVVNGTFTLDAAAQLSRTKSMMRPAPKTKDHLMDKAIEPLSMGSMSGDQSKKVIDSYLELKEALVLDDFVMAKKAASELLEVLSHNLLSESSENSESIKLQELRSLLNEIVSAENVDEQRREFKPLSAHIIQFVRSTNNYETTFFVQFCPMADGNKGAYWLSAEEEIANPYFGDQMLRCGKITEIFQ
jgi:Cu(I)/Ag(I) efflux system membrane fusion protein